MKSKLWRSAVVVLLAISVLLLLGCAAPSVPVSVPPAKVPPLPPEARQPAKIPECDPSCSERLRLDYERWQRLLMNEAPPASSASATTTR